MPNLRPPSLRRCAPISRPGMVPMAAGSRVSPNGRVVGPPRRPTRRQAPLLAEVGGGRAHDQERSLTAAFGRGPRALSATDGSSQPKQFQQIGAPYASVSHVSKILRPREEAGKSNVSSKRANGGSFRVEGQELPWYPQGCCGIGVASGTRPALLFGTHSPSPCPGLA